MPAQSALSKEKSTWLFLLPFLNCVDMPLWFATFWFKKLFEFACVCEENKQVPILLLRFLFGPDSVFQLSHLKLAQSCGIVFLSIQLGSNLHNSPNCLIKFCKLDTSVIALLALSLQIILVCWIPFPPGLSTISFFICNAA